MKNAFVYSGEVPSLIFFYVGLVSRYDLVVVWKGGGVHLNQLLENWFEVLELAIVEGIYAYGTLPRNSIRICFHQVLTT